MIDICSFICQTISLVESGTSQVRNVYHTGRDTYMEKIHILREAVGGGRAEMVQLADIEDMIGHKVENCRTGESSCRWRRCGR